MLVMFITGTYKRHDKFGFCKISHLWLFFNQNSVFTCFKTKITITWQVSFMSSLLVTEDVILSVNLRVFKRFWCKLLAFVFSGIHVVDCTSPEQDKYKTNLTRLGYNVFLEIKRKTSWNSTERRQNSKITGNLTHHIWINLPQSS